MNRLFSLLLAGLLIATFVAPSTVPGARADTVRNLYSAVVPVADYSDAERRRAIKAGLESVLVKLTGVSGIVAQPEARQLLAKASAYALEFGYVNLDGEDGAQGLTMTFTQKELDRFLRDQQLPVWPANRAPVLVWLLKEPAGSMRDFVMPEQDPGLYQRLTGIFGERGMPVRYPVYDLEDQLALSVDDAWGFNADVIQQSSKRYGVAEWLVVRCFETSAGQWRVAWIQGGSRSSALNNLEAPSLDEALVQLVGHAVDSIASGYAYIPSSNDERVVIEVAGIGDFISYRKMSRLISGLSMVKSLAVESVSGDRVSVSLGIEGERQVLLEALSRYQQLRPVDVTSDRLSFVWN